MFDMLFSLSLSREHWVLQDTHRDHLCKLTAERHSRRPQPLHRASFGFAQEVHRSIVASLHRDIVRLCRKIVGY